MDFTNLVKNSREEFPEPPRTTHPFGGYMPPVAEANAYVEKLRQQKIAKKQKEKRDENKLLRESRKRDIAEEAQYHKRYSYCPPKINVYKARLAFVLCCGLFAVIVFLCWSAA